MAADDACAPPARRFPVRGRTDELAALTGLLDRAVSGSGAALAVCGAPGSGVTAVLEAALATGPGLRVLAARGAPSETGLPFAGLHQLLAPLRGLAARLGSTQREPLDAVWALRPWCGPPAALPAAVSALLTEAATDGPTVCRVEAAHDLDPESLAALVFCARRLRGSRLALLFGADPGVAAHSAELLAELPSVRLGPLGDDAARQVLADRLGDQPPPAVSDALLTLARGNPLALTELAAAVSPAALSGLAPPPRGLSPDGRLARAVSHRLAARTPEARLLVVLAAVDDRLDLTVTGRVLPATTALDEAVDAGLVTVTGDTAVRLPACLPSCAVLAAVPRPERHRAHRLLAEAADPVTDRFRWTWHRAATVEAPAPRLAGELDAVAEAARQARNHPDAADAFERAAALTADGERRALRLVSAATDHWVAGRPRRARAALREAAPLAGGSLAGLAGLLEGEIELRSGNPALAATGLLATAHRLAAGEQDLAAATLMLAGEASFVAGDERRYCATARDAELLRPAADRAETRLVVEHFAAMAATFSGRHAEAAGPLRAVLRLGDQAADPAAKILASQAAYTLGDAAAAGRLALRAVADARARGNPAQVPWALVYASLAALLTGQHGTAVSTSLEGLRLAEALGQPNCAVDHLTILALQAALQGDGDTALLRLDAAASGLTERGLGRPGALGAWATACADLADDRPADALGRFRRTVSGEPWQYSPIRVMAAPTLVEAAVRCDRREVAGRTLAAFERWALATGGAARQALVARCHALLAADEGEAGARFGEAIELHRTAGAVHDLAHTQLLHGARLRRGRRPRQAREVLREAAQIFGELGAAHWSRRAQAELRACGHPGHGGAAPAKGELTPQQEQIAGLVAEGATNREIAERLYISHRTVDHHLRNIFAKLGIRSRVQLVKLYR